MNLEPGLIVKHTALPELGRARVDAVVGENVHLQFESATGGEAKVFKVGNENIVRADDQSPAGFPQPRVAKAAGTKARAKAPKAKSTSAWNFDTAFGRFTEKYPGGFSDAKYVKAQREPKLAAAARFKEAFGPAALGALKAAKDPAQVDQAFAKVYEGLDLLHTIEWLKFRKTLKGSPAAIGLAEEFGAVIAEGGLSEERFGKILGAFEAIGLGRGNWTLVTLWPFLASAKGAAFIKPKATRAAAEGMEFALTYDAKPNYPTYQSAQAFYEQLFSRLESKGAQDWIDVQSFIWIGWA